MRGHFRDGEVLEGVALSSLETFSRPVSYMTPPHPASNNRAVLVSKTYRQQMQGLGIKSD